MEPGKISRTARRLRNRLIARARRRGSRGRLISTHRALIRQPFTLDRGRDMLLLPLAINVLSIALAQPLMWLWHRMLAASVALTGVQASLPSTREHGGFRLWFDFVWVDMAASAPSQRQWWIGVLLTLAMLVASWLLRPRLMPIRYILRLAAILMASALAYFAITPQTFPHTLPGHSAMHLAVMLVAILVIPWVFSLTYNALDFPVGNKVVLALMAVAFIAAIAPLQAFAHALVMHYGSLLYLPILFILFGSLPIVMAMISFYAWAMTWRRPEPGGSYA